MPTLNLRVQEDLKRRLEARAKGQFRKTSDQARRYIEIAMTAEENPDLPFSFIEGLIEAKAEHDAGLRVPLDWSED